MTKDKELSLAYENLTRCQERCNELLGAARAIREHVRVAEYAERHWRDKYRDEYAAHSVTKQRFDDLTERTRVRILPDADDE